jgi:hypothetical protein
MLGDDHHSVDRELCASQRQRIGDGAELPETVLLNSLPGKVIFGELIDVDGRHFHARPLPSPGPCIALGQAIKEVLGVGMAADHGSQEGDGLGFRLLPMRR